MDKPEKRFRAGAISATVWKNQTQTKEGNREFRTISLQRGYKDKDGKWQNTPTMRINDLPKAAVVLNKAYEFLIMAENNDNAEIREEVVM